jgi:periplasmic divalent cation tolerance protein
MSQFQLIYLTCSTNAEAKALCKKAFDARLIACANIMKESESMYLWQGELKTENETVVIMKTLKSNFDKLKSLIESNHSYDCPCILGIDVSNLNTKFAEFLNSSL